MPEDNTQRATQALQQDLSAGVRGSGEARTLVIGRRGDNTLEGNLAVVPSQYRRYTAAELYQRFLINAPDHKGNYSCGFGRYGRTLKVAASYDFGDLVLPGFLSLNVGAEVQGGLGKEVLFMIHRAAGNVQYGPAPLGQAQKLWTHEQPVCFAVLSGKVYQLAAHISASLELGTGFTLGGGDSSPEETAAPEGAEAEAQPEVQALGIDAGIHGALTANAGLSGELMRLRADQLGFFADGTGNDIRSAFADALGGPSSKTLEAELIGWFEYVMEYAKAQKLANSNEIVQALAAEINPVDKIKTALSDAKKTAIESIIQLLPDEQNIKTLAESLINTLSNKATTEINTQAMLDLLKQVEKFYAGQLLSPASSPTQPAVQGWVTARPQKVQIEYRDLQKQIAWYTQLVKGQPAGPASGPVTLGQLLCHANLYTFKANGQINGLASISGSVNTGQGAVGGGGEAAGVLAGDVKFASMRYQTAVPTTGARLFPWLVLTQDTQVTYRRLAGNASWSVNITLEDYGLEAGTGTTLEKKFFDLITYQTYSAYWSHPRKGGISSVALRMGSGISFGCSVNWCRLQNIALATTVAGSAQDKEADQRLLQKLAKALHVRVDTLKTFLSRAFAPSPGAEAAAADPIRTLDNYRTVILEANYAFCTLPSISLKEDSKTPGLYHAPDLGEVLEIKNMVTALKTDLKSLTPVAISPTTPYRLDSIRIRVRNEDNEGNFDNSHPIFTLGFDFRAALKVTYGKTQTGSGNEGILDVYTCWFNPDYEALPQNGFERSVPPAVLLPHSLFEKADTNPIKE